MRKLYVLLGLILVGLMDSCESVFPNDDLDNFWKLRIVEYRSGFDFDGAPCQSKTVDDYMFGFARHLLVIRPVNDIHDEYGMHAVTSEFSDSIKFDFSSCHTSALDTLKQCGIDSMVTVFRLDYPDRNTLLLSGSKTVLLLEKW